MAKKKRTVETIELTMSTDYVKSWGAREGVRELVQNALDANRLLDAAISIHHDEDMKQLVITTVGQKLELRTLLLGVSEKGDNASDAIGRYGEGYKVGCLAILRDGKSVTIRTATQVWRPRFERSDRFGVPILSFDIEEGHEDCGEIRVTVGGVSVEEWTEYQKMFRVTAGWRNFRDVGVYDRYQSSGSAPHMQGTVIYDSDQKGRVYVGGIFVASDDKLGYGYDLPPKLFTLDRDRSSIRHYELLNALALFWQSAYLEATRTKDEHFLESTANTLWKWFDAKELEESYNVRSDFEQTVLDAFKAEQGEDKYPVVSLEQFEAAVKVGLRPVHVPERMHKILSRLFKSIELHQKQHAQQVQQSWSIESLTADESAKLTWAWDLVKAATAHVFQGIGPDIKLPEPQAAVFNSEQMLGVCVPDMRQIYVARRIIGNRGKLLVTLVHEVAHFGVEAHGRALVAIEEAMFEYVMNRLFDEDSDEARLAEEVKSAPKEEPEMPF